MDKPKIIKSVKIRPELLARIEKQAKKERRNVHWLMVEALEKVFK